MIKPLSKLEAFQYVKELERKGADPQLIEYAKSLEPTSTEMALLKIYGKSSDGFKQWGTRQALRAAKNNTREGKKLHDTKGNSREVLGLGSNKPATPEDWARYNDGKLELFTSEDGTTRFVTPEQYRQFADQDFTDRSKGNYEGDALRSRLDEPLGIIDRPAYFTAEELAALPESGAASDSYYQGPADKAPLGSAYYKAQAAHNKYVTAIAEELEKKGYFTGEDGKPKMSGKKSPVADRELTAREYFEQSRKLNYGHRGASSNAGFGSLSSWIGNASPEFEYYNKLEGALLTPQEAININDINTIQGDRGSMIWDGGNLTKFDRVNADLDNLVLSNNLQISDRVLKKRNDGVSYLKTFDSSDNPLDPNRDRIHSLLSDPVSDATTQGKVNSNALLGTQNQLSLGKNPDPGQALGRLGLLNQVDGFQMDAWLNNRGEERLRGIFGDTQTDQIKTALANQEGEKRWLESVRESLDKIRAGGKNVTVDDLMRIASSSGRAVGKGAIGLAPMIALMTNAEAAEAYDRISVDVGEDLWAALASRVGAKESWDAFKSRVSSGLNTAASGAYGPQNQLGAVGAQFGLSTLGAVASELPGLIATAVQTPVAPEGNMSWLERQQQNAWNNQDPMLNMVPVFQPANPVKKFGGVVQPMYGDPMLYE